jgi:hypothetical protein
MEQRTVTPAMDTANAHKEIPGNPTTSKSSELKLSDFSNGKPLQLLAKKANSQTMCSKLTGGGAKSCPCKCSHLCKRARQIGQVQVNLQELFNKASTINNSMLPAIANYGIVNKSFNAKESHAAF